MNLCWYSPLDLRAYSVSIATSSRWAQTVLFCCVTRTTHSHFFAMSFAPSSLSLPSQRCGRNMRRPGAWPQRCHALLSPFSFGEIVGQLATQTLRILQQSCCKHMPGIVQSWVLSRDWETSGQQKMKHKTCWAVPSTTQQKSLQALQGSAQENDGRHIGSTFILLCHSFTKPNHTSLTTCLRESFVTMYYSAIYSYDMSHKAASRRATNWNWLVSCKASVRFAKCNCPQSTKHHPIKLRKLQMVLPPNMKQNQTSCKFQQSSNTWLPNMRSMEEHPAPAAMYLE